jgi:hypothetical protein
MANTYADSIVRLNEHRERVNSILYGTTRDRRREIPEILSRFYLELLNANDSTVRNVQKKALEKLFDELKTVLKLKGRTVDAIILQIRQVTDDTVDASIMTIVREHDLIPISSQLSSVTSQSLYQLVGINSNRNGTIVDSNQHLSLSDDFYRTLYDIGVRIECFSAGCTNSRFCNQQMFPDAKFCALFYDPSPAYIGDFFRLIENDRMPEGDLIANPPFVETIMERTVKALFKQVMNHRVTGHLVLPKWDDCEAFTMLRNAPDGVKVTEAKYDFDIIGCNGETVPLKTKLVYFIITH